MYILSQEGGIDSRSYSSHMKLNMLKFHTFQLGDIMFGELAAIAAVQCKQCTGLWLDSEPTTTRRLSLLLYLATITGNLL